ncbi:hypothetical protein DRO42_07970 [Candidatus Bathyarchaeota archaeon]|nr:MAG: hypothetical protein DRO42_07970 [Candidatus Bathyarchaeota archaeon]
MRSWLFLFFFTSGGTALILEVLWTRILGNVFGNTVYAASTVLTAYMLGLALGSWFFGRIADRSSRPVVLYGCLELGVGLYALLFPLLTALTGSFYKWFYGMAQPDFAAMTAVRFFLSLLLLLPPTTLMGGTLPVLGTFLGAARKEPGKEVGLLYGINTLGAVLGCFAAGFLLIKSFGVTATLMIAGLLAVSVGTGAIILGRQKTAEKPLKKVKAPSRSEVLEPGILKLVILCFGVTGFCALAYEVLWTRILLFVMTTSVYSFATMLTAFLAGIGLGSLVSANLLLDRIKRPVLAFGMVEIFVALSSLASLPVLAKLNVIDLYVSTKLAAVEPHEIVVVRFIDAACVILLPTFLMGVAFPIITKAALRDRRLIGLRIGQLYASNTIGAVLGSATAGFVLLPFLGASGSLLALVAVNTFVGLILVWYGSETRTLRRLVWAVPLSGIIFSSFALTPKDVFYDTINTYHHPYRVIYVREHPTGTVSVHDLPGLDRLIAVDGVNVAGTDFMLRTTQKLQGYIPLMLHPNPRKVVQIGFGSGETTRVGLSFGVPDYTVVEICPAVFEAGPLFEEINKGSYREPRLKKVIMDGKNFAFLSKDKFDIVMNDSIYPGSRGSSALYTVDHFRNCRKRLLPGGLFSCWVPLDLRPLEFRMILRSFIEVFPHASVWVASNCLNKHSLFLGTLERLKIDFRHLQRVMNRPQVARDLAEIAMFNPYDILDCFVLDEEAIRKLAQGVPPNTDNMPRLEFSCAIREPWEISLQKVLSLLAKYRTPVKPYVVNVPNPEELDRRYRATNMIFRAQVAQLAGVPEVRRKYYREALRINPGEVHVKTCEQELAREIQQLRTVISAFPNLTVLRLRLAEKLWISENYREAAQIYESLIKKFPPPGEIAFIRLAQILFREGKRREAEDILKRCLYLYPDSAEAHDKLAGIYHRMGRRKEALKHIERALRIAPQNRLYQRHKEAILGKTAKAEG